MKGLSVNVFRWKHDCTNNGITSKYDNFILTGDGIPEIFSPDDNTPELKLVRRNISGYEYLHCEPVNNPGNGWYTAGGNFVYTSDSRFPNKYPISVHDRIERN